MNIVEVAKKLKNGQIAYSKELGVRITKVDDYHLYEVNSDNEICDKLDFNPNVWCDDSWEIEIEWVDFWTAWKAYKAGKNIQFESWTEPILDDNNNVNQYTICIDEIDGRWRILD